MKWSFNFGVFYRGLMLALLGLFLYAFWVEAQPTVPATNAVVTVTDTRAVVIADAKKQTVAEVIKEPPRALLTFGLDRIEPLTRAFAGIPLWQYISTTLYIFLAFLLSKILDWAVCNRFQAWASRTKTNLDDIIIKLLHGPIKIVTFVILLHFGLQFYDWPAWAEDSIRKLLGLMVAFSITYLALKFIDLGTDLWHERTKEGGHRLLHRQLFPVLRKTAKIAVVVLAFLFTAQNVFGQNITALLAGVSIGGLALGLAAQDTLANLFGAVAVFVDKPFQIGDWVTLEGQSGSVESIGLRSTRIRNLDGHLITIPNKTVGNAIIINVSRRPNIKTTLNFGLTYDTPTPRIEEAVNLLEGIYREHPLTGEVHVSFNRFDPSSLNLRVFHVWKGTDPNVHLKDMEKLNLEIKQRFETAGIEFAFPTQTIYLGGEANRTLESESRGIRNS